MQGFLLVLICCVMSSDFVVYSLGLPSVMHFIPELMSGVVIVYVLIFGTRDHFRLVAPKYWLVFGALAFVMLCGIILNGTGAGPIISGMRFYLRGVPIFFLAAVLPITDVHLRRQFKWLLALAFIQVPLTGYQRWVVMSQGRFTGDDVHGTVLDSGVLTMFLVCAVFILTGLLLKHRLSKLLYCVLFLLLLIPTTINETKVTVVFLPLGLLVTVLLGAARGKRLTYAGIGLTVLIAFGAVFIPVYDMMQAHNPYKIKIVDFFTNEKALNNYLAVSNKNSEAGIGRTKLAGRGDSIVVPLAYLARDPVDLAFGLGLGNVSPSNLGRNFEGAYFRLFRSVLVTSFAYFTLEFGLIGVLLIGCLFCVIFMDAVRVARLDQGLTGALAAGWTGVMALFALATVYNVFFQFASVTYLYWYFAGVIAARGVALGYQAAQVPTRSPRAKTATA
ncbi:MAG: hypothetical protein M3N91_11000 [Pseudomonadota bacterium]|nr:hypothetical protein [Pseudomonadota bacterium]